MIAIQGSTYAEVFAKISDCDAFDARDRAAAKKLTEYYQAVAAWKERDEERTSTPEGRKKAEEPRPAAPFRRGPRYDDLYRTTTGNDYEVWEIDGLHWEARPYTATGAVNIGVEAL